MWIIACYAGIVIDVKVTVRFMNRPFGCEWVYLPLRNVADTPFHI